MGTQETIHDAAAKGFQIAGDAYERGRPEYPADAVTHLKQVLEIGPSRIVVDLGAGTGKFTKLLLASEAKVLAVEPVEGMRRKFLSLLPDTEILNGAAESIPLADLSVDAVVVAQAFHWFDGEKALREIHRILKPSGKLGLIWNARDERLDWVAQLTQIIDKYEGGAPRYRSGFWRKAFEQSHLFSALESEHFKCVQKGTAATIVDRVTSISFISALPANDKRNVIDEVLALLAIHPLTKGRSEIELPYRTDVFWCMKV